MLMWWWELRCYPTPIKTEERYVFYVGFEKNREKEEEEAAAKGSNYSERYVKNNCSIMSVAFWSNGLIEGCLHTYKHYFDLYALLCDAYNY